MKAIETKYKGYRFRSRLEARWAVFFDAINLPYQYELEGYEVLIGPDSNQPVRYLPDFYLPTIGCHVEVKGTKCSSADAEKMGWVLDFCSPLPWFHGSKYPDLDEMLAAGVTRPLPGLLLLGDVPYINHGIVTHPFITHHKGLFREYVEFLSAGPMKEGCIRKVTESAAQMLTNFSSNNIWNDHDYLCGGDTDTEFFDSAPIAAESKLAYIKVCLAYRTARSARFEHGECPA